MGRQRRFQLAFPVVCLLFVFADPASAFVLLGPSRAEDGSHGASSPNTGFFQAFDAGFRWSSSNLTYAFDSSFINAFGVSGADAVRNSFATWDVAFGVTDAPTSTGFVFDPGPDVFDIESISLHEIGHTLGFHHPD